MKNQLIISDNTNQENSKIDMKIRDSYDILLIRFMARLTRHRDNFFLLPEDNEMFLISLKYR